MAANENAMYFRKGFGLKADVQETLATDYSGRLVDLLQTRGYALTSGDVTVRLAREFGFCYGVERAVEYAYQTRTKFPDRRILLVGEIIHNPHVNDAAARDGDRDPGSVRDAASTTARSRRRTSSSCPRSA